MDIMEWRTRYWDDSEVSQLLVLWGDERVQRELDGTRRDNQVFIKLSEDLRRRGILRSPAQVREKIKILKREYRLCLGRLNQAGQSMPTKFKYFEQMCTILGQQTNLNFGRVQEGPSLGISEPSTVSSYSLMANSGGMLIKSQDNTEANGPLDLHVGFKYGERKVSIVNIADGNRSKVNAGGIHDIETRNWPEEGHCSYRRPFGTDNAGIKDTTHSISTNSSIACADRLSDSSNGSVNHFRSNYKRKCQSDEELKFGRGSKRKTVKGVKKTAENLDHLFDKLFSFFEESSDRFFRLEEARMRHEKDMEAMRREGENRLFEKLCQIVTKPFACCDCCKRCKVNTQKCEVIEKGDDAIIENREEK